MFEAYSVGVRLHLIDMDGRKIATAVTDHQVKGMNGPSTGITRFDPTLSYVPIGN